MQSYCIRCKGKNPAICGRTFCPITAKAEAMFKVKELTEKDFFGSSPLPFVGSYGYPYVNVGIMSPPEVTEEAWKYDAPKYWAENDYKIPQIVTYRSALINSRFKAQVKGNQHKFLELSQEIGMASKPVDVEINLEKKPFVSLNFSPEHAPMGPKGELRGARAIENPKIHTKVDKVVSDTDLKSTDAMFYLFKNNFDENFLTRLLSIGVLGIKKNRRLVPTKWSTTAVHDTIAKKLLSKIKDYPLSDYKAYFGSYLGNYYLLLFFPEVWSYELFETYMPKASWNVDKEIQFTTDYEPYEGRKTYAENCAGGWYSVRMAIAEYLYRIKRQASCLVIRVITGEYAVPLGVWVTTSSVRKAFSNKPIEFSDKELILKYAIALIKKKFDFNLNNLLKESILLRNIKQQAKLTQFL